jgi:aminoglycoside phosphotransferase (APT) family kinase protein
MHEGEVDIDVELVRALVAEQLPSLRDLPITEVRSTGTVNAIFRLGDSLCARLPRVARWADDLVKELEWLPRLAPQLPIAIPEPVARGMPGSGYPFEWAVFRWIDGEVLSPEGSALDELELATDLARFVRALRAIDIMDAPRSGRRPLAELDSVTRGAIAALPPDLDRAAIGAAWDVALSAPAWDHREVVWRHGDLLPPNLLIADGHLRAVVDFGTVGIGDPAHDVIAAWSALGPIGRVAFREALEVDDGTWARARGVALHQALMIIPYYLTTNPGFVTMAQRTVAQVLAERVG